MSFPKQLKAKLIYNPHAGAKRRIIGNTPNITLEDIKSLLDQYQIPVDYFPTRAPSHATELAREAKKEGYKLVLVAGGDGTVGEVANGLIGSNLTLGILPLGSYMNIARMLSIPIDLEKAIALIKIGRSRKIDVGSVVKLNGEKLTTPYYFIESAGIGLEAELQEQFLQLERGDKKAIFRIFKTLFEFYGRKAKIVIDDKTIETRATMVSISNGPFTGAAIPLAPQAKLNDHRLTVTLFRMTKIELLNYFLKITRSGKRYSPKVKTFQAKKVQIKTGTQRLVHADARKFGTTPVEFRVVPSALNVITGFPKAGESSLVKRTYLDP